MLVIVWHHQTWGSDLIEKNWDGCIYGKKLDIKFPHSHSGRLSSWKVNKQAAEDWLRAFLKRHPKLSVRKPEPTLIS